MSALPFVREQVDLGFIARKIEEAYSRAAVAGEQAKRSGRAQLEHAYAAGQWLAEAKKRLPFGAFMGWVEANTSLKHRTATLYMSLVDYWPQIGNAANLASASKAIVEIRKWERRRTARAGLVYEQRELPLDSEAQARWEHRRPARDPDYFSELSCAIHTAVRFAQRDPAQIAAELGRRGEFRGAVASLVEFLPRLGAVLGQSATQERP